MERASNRINSLAASKTFWDVESGCLWIDLRKIMPDLGVVEVMAWDAMMLSDTPIPHYDKRLTLLTWPTSRAIADWKKCIPNWILQSCCLFPSHQMRLLHFCGRYPQMVELLDHSPLLAWRLVSTGLTQDDIVGLLSQKRTEQVAKLGWPGKSETVQFLRNLRLRLVNDELLEYVEVCLTDDKRLTALQHLPRINSMALSLASRFPDIIGCRLHQSLAKLPCRPMQCKSMVAQLEDAYRLANACDLSAEEINKIGDSRYLVDVEKIYQAWLKNALKSAKKSSKQPGLVSSRLSEICVLAKKQGFYALSTQQDWQVLSTYHQHAWFTDFSLFEAKQCALFVMEEAGRLIGFLVECGTQKLIRCRQENNALPTAEQLSRFHLSFLSRFK